MKSQLLRFGLVGIAGYVVDSAVLYLCLSVGWGPAWGRLVSFLCAVATTWLLNRKLTFDAPTEHQHPASVIQEALRYLSAMLLGGALNLLTYGWIMRNAPAHSALPALAVAAGSLVGMLANFTGAKYWVYEKRTAHSSAWLHSWTGKDAIALATLQTIFWFCQLHDASLPGLYMDAVNPDYLAARTLNPEISNPIWIMPTALFPVLGSPYHGVQNFYVGLPVFALLGFNMFALRIAQGLFGAGIVAAMYALGKRITSSTWLAWSMSAALTTDLAFISSFRTQNYIVISGCFWLLCAMYLFYTTAPDGQAEKSRRLLWSGVCAGLAVYSYFVFLFFLPAFLLLLSFNGRQKSELADWLKGFVAGMCSYVVGYALLIIQLRGFMPTKEWLQQTLSGLNPLSSQLSLHDSIVTAWGFVELAIKNRSNELMIFGVDNPSLWSNGKPLFFCMCTMISIWPWMAQKFRSGVFVSGESPFLRVKPSQWVLFPISFFVCTLYFGNRLWGHHFSSLIPLIYLLAGTALMVLSVNTVARHWLVPMIVASMLIGNMWQQTGFFNKLEQTGGQGKFSDAINRMASDALTLPASVIHIFPEWGLMMPFAFLTGNQRTYLTEINPNQIQNFSRKGQPIRVYFFKSEDSSKYLSQLIPLGLHVTGQGSYLQRNELPAFYWIELLE